MASIRKSQQGFLFFDFYYRAIRCREYTLLTDTIANRRLAAGTLKDIERAIRAGTFSYRSFFPNSPRADVFEPPRPPLSAATIAEITDAASAAMTTMLQTNAPVSVPVGSRPLFSEFSDRWFQEKEVEWMHSTQVKNRDILRKHLVPRFKGRRVSDISREDILNLRTHLAKDSRDGHGLSPSRINGILNIQDSAALEKPPDCRTSRVTT